MKLKLVVGAVALAAPVDDGCVGANVYRSAVRVTSLKYGTGFFAGKRQGVAKKQEEINTGRKTGTKSSLNLKNYAGTYEDVLYGKSKIEWKDGKLFLTMLPTKEVFTGELKHWENDRFEIKFKDIYLPRGFVNFEIKDQKVEYFTIDLPNPDFHFHKLKFYKKVDK